MKSLIYSSILTLFFIAPALAQEQKLADTLINKNIIEAIPSGKNKSCSYSTQNVSIDNIVQARVLSLANSLSGKVAGLEVTESTQVLVLPPG